MQRDEPGVWRWRRTGKCLGREGEILFTVSVLHVVWPKKAALPFHLCKGTSHLTVEPPVDERPLCKKKWSPRGGGLSCEVLHGNKRA